VIEALTSGSSLVLSDIPVFRELADGVARFVPLDAPPAETGTALDEAWDEPVPDAARDDLAARYSWDAVTRGLRRATGR
jgi:glycosyltransferase involved in cell wall biosynthesis